MLDGRLGRKALRHSQSQASLNTGEGQAHLNAGEGQAQAATPRAPTAATKEEAAAEGGTKEEAAAEGAKEGGTPRPTAKASSLWPVALEGKLASAIPRSQATTSVADVAAKAMEAQEVAHQLAVWLKVP